MTRSEYEGIVYDLDNTLVHLQVDWEGAREDTAERYRDAGIDPGDRGLWALLTEAEEHGIREEIESAVTERERAGARASERLPTADELPAGVPVAVCSLNSEAACRIALERHDLIPHVDHVVGRDTLPVHKPDPQPLLSAIEALDRRPADVVFVGDSERDEETARRAGVPFQYVHDSGGD